LVDPEAGCSHGIVRWANNAAAALVRIGWNRHVLEDLSLVPDVVAGRDYMRAEVEDLLSDGGGDSEAAGSVLSVDDQKIDRVSLKDVGKVLVYDVATG